MEYLLTLLYTIVFLFILIRAPFFRAEGLSKKTISIIFIVKILAGIIMSLIYTYYYPDRKTADIFKYFDDSKVMYNALFHKPLDYLCMMTGIGNDSPYFNEHYYKIMNNWYRVYESNIYNESHTIIRFNALIRLFSFGYYNVHTVFMCFLSLIGLVALYKASVNLIKNKNKELIFGIFLLPSVLFWGSGVMKEGLLFFGLGVLIYYFCRILNRFTMASLFWIFASLLLLYYIKFYVFAIILPVLAAHLWIALTNNSATLLKYAIVFVLYFLIGLNLHYIYPGFDALDILVTKQHDFIRLAKYTHSGSLIDIPLLTHNPWNFIMYAPLAFFNTFFRPFISEAGSILVLMAALENLMLFFACIFTLFFLNFRKIDKIIFFDFMFIVIFMFTLTGLITPVTGAIVRYKVPALPFFMILLIMLIDKEKMIKKFPFLKFLK